MTATTGARIDLSFPEAGKTDTYTFHAITPAFVRTLIEKTMAMAEPPATVAITDDTTFVQIPVEVLKRAIVKVS
jgi:hypothetical protein